jgi:hypothetical protein
MEVIKRKILLEDSTDRTFNSPNWGSVTATTFYINVMLTQTMDDMGLFTDMDYISLSGTPNILTGVTGTTQITLRLPYSGVTDYYNFGNSSITGSTDSKIEEVRSYNASNPFRIAFNTSAEDYIDYNNVSVSGISRVISMGEPKVYAFDTQDDLNLGTPNQVYGLLYTDYTGTTRQVTIDGVTNNIPVTNYKYIGQGWNETNTTLSALTKEEYLFGIISPPIVQSDVFIDRGITSVMDMHLRLSEIKDLGQLNRYGNGFYNLTKQ